LNGPQGRDSQIVDESEVRSKASTLGELQELQRMHTAATNEEGLVGV
jgi:hypothetical protein